MLLYASKVTSKQLLEALVLGTQNYRNLFFRKLAICPLAPPDIHDVAVFAKQLLMKIPDTLTFSVELREFVKICIAAEEELESQTMKKSTSHNLKAFAAAFKQKAEFQQQQKLLGTEKPAQARME